LTVPYLPATVHGYKDIGRCAAVGGSLSFGRYQPIAPSETVRLSGQEANAFFPASETTYCSSAVDFELTVTLDDGSTVTGLTIR
jgi:hypothetical protein